MPCRADRPEEGRSLQILLVVAFEACIHGAHHSSKGSIALRKGTLWFSILYKRLGTCIYIRRRLYHSIFMVFKAGMR